MPDILIAFLVISGIGLVLGILLAVASHFFSVPEDTTYVEIRACLPGINCGACGYKGCDDYAHALADDHTIKPNLCIPGAQMTADQIGAILGVEAEPFKDVVAYVACNGHCGATHNKADYDGVSTCRAASLIYGGPSACAYGCLGYGDCADACPSSAICTIDGVARIDTSRCLGCGVCAATCPKGIIHMLPQEAGAAIACHNQDTGAVARKVCQNACIGCKKCEKTCPQGAITVTNNLAAIDYDKCTGCGACVACCPTGCLHETSFPNLPEGIDPKSLLDD